MHAVRALLLPCWPSSQDACALIHDLPDKMPVTSEMARLAGCLVHVHQQTTGTKPPYDHAGSYGDIAFDSYDHGVVCCAIVLLERALRNDARPLRELIFTQQPDFLTSCAACP